ncbi:MAG: hypothetical protein RLZZ123_268 [Pseudomonadota bacterium]|jgi:Toxin co-regulated pilus biosynthesis protein Q
MKSPLSPMAPASARTHHAQLVWALALLLALALPSHAQSQSAATGGAGADNGSLFAAPVVRFSSVELERVQKFDTMVTDRSVSRLLDRWARQAGVGFVWDAKSDVTLSTQDRFVGTIEQATERLIGGLSGITLQACIYTNNPPVIRITESGTPCE